MINYGILNDSLNYYQKLGYNRVEIPWTVTAEISAITKPLFAKDFILENRDKVLVASAEQGFLYQYLKGFLPKGRFIAVSPCFRDEKFDPTHTKYFMKSELIDTEFVNYNSLNFMIDKATCFFEKHLNNKVDIIKTEVGYDIEYQGVEIGSYGIRECSFLKWIYGTAVAEPRFSRLIK